MNRRLALRTIVKTVGRTILSVIEKTTDKIVRPTAVVSLPVLTIVCLGLLALPLPAAENANQLTANEVAEGWILLFDGQTLFGWQPTGKAQWRVEDGALTAAGEPGLLVTTSRFVDYELSVDFRAEPGTNSGVFLRTIPDPQPADVATRCYEVNIAGRENAFPTGSLVQRKAAPWPGESDQWRTLRMTAQGPRIAVALDGKPLVDYSDPQPLGRGHIGLQWNQGRVAFRNVKLRPLGMKPISTGKDLEGWKLDPDSKSRASVTPEGWIRLQGGKGQLESAARYTDFVLQLDVLVSTPGLNSGVFFRSIPGEVQNGYESQIHNGFKNGDRTQPVDCGTGGIFRRQNARKVVSDDGQWFTKTIVADGPHFAVWVNGYPVTDWTDARPADANPRKGLRLAAGTIILQGHDPTTDLLFRNIRIGEMANR